MSKVPYLFEDSFLFIFLPIGSGREVGFHSPIRDVCICMYVIASHSYRIFLALFFFHGGFACMHGGRERNPSADVDVDADVDIDIYAR